MEVKVRRKASLHRDYKGDYLDVPSQPYLIKILEKQDVDLSMNLMHEENVKELRRHGVLLDLESDDLACCY
ncbi:hypothetical protein RJ641_033760 [Dillenia turbinata]|uniref:Uncharacterized protein n=1 Tax=Dillenia turbinata TaxID=194707 RepID=A0AAN8VM83_9MAGN